MIKVKENGNGKFINWILIVWFDKCVRLVILMIGYKKEDNEDIEILEYEV